MQITVGDMGAIAGVLIYRPAFAGHLFRKPNIIAIGYVCFGIAAATYLWIAMSRENRRRDAILAAGASEKGVKSGKEFGDETSGEGDRHIEYRYQL